MITEKKELNEYKFLETSSHLIHMTDTALVKVFPINTNGSITSGKIFVPFRGFAQRSGRRKSRFRYPLSKEKKNYFETSSLLKIRKLGFFIRGHEGCSPHLTFHPLYVYPYNDTEQLVLHACIHKYIYWQTMYFIFIKKKKKKTNNVF